VISTKAALEQGKIDPATVDAVYFGNVIQSCPDTAYLARHVGLKSGKSGFETVIQGANAIRVGDAKIALCGGAENMSAAPLQASGNDARWGVNLGSGLALRDALWDGLTDTYSKTPMGMTTENLAEKYNNTRKLSAWNVSCCCTKYKLSIMLFSSKNLLIGLRRVCDPKSKVVGRSKRERHFCC
jgi:acetyl-CoA acyltransferase 2